MCSVTKMRPLEIISSKMQ